MEVLGSPSQIVYTVSVDLNGNTEPKSCGKVEVVVLGSPSLIVYTVPEVKQHSELELDISICACKRTSTVYISICACKQTSTIYITICACKQTSTILVYICASQQTNRTFSLVEFHDRRYGEIFTGHRVSSDKQVIKYTHIFEIIFEI